MFGSELFRFPESVDRIAEVEQTIDIAPAGFVSDDMRGNSCSHRQTSNHDLFGAVLRSDFVENSSVASDEYLFRVGVLTSLHRGSMYGKLNLTVTKPRRAIST